jgi:phage-related protein
MATIREDVVKIGFDIDMGDLNKLTDELDGLKKSVSGGIGDDALDELVKDTKKAADGLDDVKDSVKGIKPDGIDDTTDGLKETSTEAQKAHGKLKKLGETSMNKAVSGVKKLASGLGKVAIAAGKAVAKAMALAATGVGTMVTMAVKSYADYEQLTGGVDTLFGGSQSIEDYTKSISKSTSAIKEFQKANGLAVDGIIGPKTRAAIEESYSKIGSASEIVQKNAAQAYKTAGLSANDYMETVTSFSASLISSLGGDTVKAANYADMAITDMSDNANKMGTDMGSIQDAYQGFAKQNYTMLDNLKLGYGGTQEEMKRLLKDAGKLAGKKFDIKNYSDIIEAIHVIQDEMGITGTTAEEADKTISGSFNSMKAAWSNTLVSLVVGGDSFDDCIDNLVDSAKTFAKNVMPAIVKALEGMGDLIEALAPILEKELPGIIDSLLPPLIKAATALVKGLIKALPSIISAIVDEIPFILRELWDGIKDAFGEIPGMKKVETFFGKLNKVFTKNADKLKKIIPVVIGLIGAFKLLKKLKGLGSLLGGVLGKGTGGSSGGLLGTFTKLGKTKMSVILKGMANLAIILGGLTLLAAALMYVAPYMARLTDVKSLVKVLAVITALGLIGSALAKLAGIVGKIPVATVAKGLANIAIIMVGLGALTALLMWVAPYIAELSDLRTVAKLLIVIAAVGVVGSALAGLAGLVGAIPITLVLEGLANIALALGGVTAIIAAFGALSMIDGFNEFISSGGETLKTIFNIIGQCAGAVIGGFGEGVSESLPAIGENLAAFGTAIQPLFTSFSGIDLTGFNDFLGAFSRFVLVMTGEKVLSFITGGVNYADLGTQLTAFADNAAGFFTTVAAIPEAAFTNITLLFNALAGVNALPKEGGLLSWFTGESTTGMANIAANLPTLATSISSFMTNLGDITDFTPLSSLFTVLGGVSALPQEGGLFSWFTGESTTGMANIAANLPTLATSVATFFANLGGIADFTPISSLFNTLGSVSALPKEGGLMSWFAGDSTVGLANVAAQLPGLATSVGAFFANLGGVTDFTPISSLFTALGGITAMPKEGGISSWFGGDSSTSLSNVASQLPGVASSISTFFANLGGITDFTPISNLFNTLGSINIDASSADKGFLGWGQSKLESLGAGLSAFATNAATFFDTVNGLNTENLDSFFTTVGKAGDLPDALSGIDSELGTQMSNMVTTIETGFTNVKTALTSAVNSMVQTCNDKYSAFQTAGAYMMSGLKAGMESKLSSLVTAAQSMASKIQKAFDVKMQINSPSKVMFEKGSYVGQGLVKGMESTTPSIQMAAQHMGSASMPFDTYSPDAGNVYNNSSSSEQTSVAPVFNLTISGSTDDRSLARRVKQWVSESINETFESMERRNRLVRET